LFTICAVFTGRSPLVFLFSTVCATFSFQTLFFILIEPERAAFSSESFFFERVVSPFFSVPQDPSFLGRRSGWRLLLSYPLCRMKRNSLPCSAFSPPHFFFSFVPPSKLVVYTVFISTQSYNAVLLLSWHFPVLTNSPLTDFSAPFTVRDTCFPALPVLVRSFLPS